MAVVAAARVGRLCGDYGGMDTDTRSRHWTYVFCGIGAIAIAMGWGRDKSGALVHLVFG